MFGSGFAKMTLAAAAGAAAAHLLDPDRGRARRARLRDQARSTFRRDVRAVLRRLRYNRGKIKGLVHETAGQRPAPPVHDQVLVDKIRSEVLGRLPEIAHHVTLDAADGVVTLRGQLDSSHEIARLETSVRRVAGVRRVVNLLHLPAEVAPNKVDVRGLGG
jgi:osmotically-inducible protein OsmY